MCPTPLPKVRKRLSADALIGLLRRRFESLPDPRGERAEIPLADALMAAFGMFSLKSPSLLAFDQARENQNLHTLFQIGRIPSDTAMREILDPVSPLLLRPAFQDVFREVQRGKVLEKYVFYQGCFLLAMDGTEYFSSEKIHCVNCQVKVHSKTGRTSYSHQMLGAAIVHPNLKEVLPFAPEPIIRQDGRSKNDCERNAARRLVARIRQDHPHLGLIVIEDALSSNAPHVRDLLALNIHFILRVKPGDHAFLYEHVYAALKENPDVQWCSPDPERPGWTRLFTAVHDVPLNESNQDVKVNFLGYAECNPQGEIVKEFHWVTDFRITRKNAYHFACGGRARWKIENETFNTLKNQGYRFEHNFGHGYQNLSVVFAFVMMLAFLVDQVQQVCCPLFQATWKKMQTKRRLWEELRSHYAHFVFRSMRQLYETMLTEAAKSLEPPGLDSS